MRRLLALLATDPNIPFLHAPAEVGAEPVYASRSVTGMYRTSPLRGIWQHPPYFHDGSAADLLAVVNHYDEIFRCTSASLRRPISWNS